MEPLKVFVASSGNITHIVDAFAVGLQNSASPFVTRPINVERWWLDLERNENLLTALIDHCRGNPEQNISHSDFFVAFLTPDDMRQKKKGKSSKVPRDNCIFELGLFIGGLAQRERCLMLCDASLGEAALPSDLGGQLYQTFDLAAVSKCKNAVEIQKCLAGAIQTVVSTISKWGPARPLRFASLSPLELMLLERDVDKDSVVVVYRAQPLEERDPQCAAFVNANLRDGIRYEYFFHDLTKYNFIASLVHSIATANPDAEGNASQNKAELPRVRKNLELMRRLFRINLIPSKGPIEFCIHNADISSEATCYLNDATKKYFVQYCTDDGASNIGSGLLSLTKIKRKERPVQIFSPTTVFDIMHPDKAKLRKQFLEAIRECFNEPELNSTLAEVCFGRAQ
jgi:CAP12/Pycsar effector protein, TIR domain